MRGGGPEQQTDKQSGGTHDGWVTVQVDQGFQHQMLQSCLFCACCANIVACAL